MTEPRRYLPGYCHKTTRRTTEGRKFMAPDRAGVCRHTIGYLVAHAVKKSRVKLLSFAAMSNHYHNSDIDTHGNHGKFLSTLNGLLGRVFNMKLGREGHFWDAKKPSVQRIVGLDAHIDQFLYIVLNPVKSGLVPTAAEWPGFIVTPDMIGKTLTFRRPDLPFFRTKKGRAMPEEIQLTIHEPPGAAEIYGPGGYAGELARRLAEEEVKIQLERAGLEAETPPRPGGQRAAGTMRGRIGTAAPTTPLPPGQRAGWKRELRAGGNSTDHARGFLGLNKLFDTDPLSPTKTPEIKGYLREVVCNDPERLVFELGELQEFRRLHHRARRAKASRKRGVVFPAGTYALRLYYGVKVAPPANDDELFATALAEHEQMRAAA